VVELIAGMIFGLACIGLGVFQLVAPRQMARINRPVQPMVVCAHPVVLFAPTMKQHLDEDPEARASRRFFGPVFIAMGVVITVKAAIAAISAT
jgi:hypothetical protein